MVAQEYVMQAGCTECATNLASAQKSRSLSLAVENQSFDLAINGSGIVKVRHFSEPQVGGRYPEVGCPSAHDGSQSYGSADRKVKKHPLRHRLLGRVSRSSRYAMSLAQEFQARLTLLHIMEGLEPTLLDERERITKPSVVVNEAGAGRSSAVVRVGPCGGVRTAGGRHTSSSSRKAMPTSS